MKEILSSAEEYLEFVSVRAVAHEKSAESHRSVGTRWGIFSTALSAIVGSALFVSLADKFGLTGDKNFTFLANWSPGWRILVYVIIGLVLILSPILTNIQAFLNQPQQVEKHKISCAKYFRLKSHLELFIFKYQKKDSSSINIDDMLKELGEITKEIPVIISEGITLSKKAFKEAEEEYRMKFYKR